MSKYKEIQALLDSVHQELKEREQNELALLGALIDGFRSYLGCGENELKRLPIGSNDELGDRRVSQYAIRNVRKWLVGLFSLRLDHETREAYIRVKYAGGAYDVAFLGARCAVSIDDAASHEKML